MRAFGALVAALAGFVWVSAAAAPSFNWALPKGVAPPPVPADNPMTPEKVELGERLFVEPALSRDFSMSCDTCHQRHRGFSETLSTHPGVDEQAGKRNAPGLANVGYFSVLTWANPANRTLEAQASDPIFGEHPVEMGMAKMEAELIRRLSADACYRRQFAAAFPEETDPISIKTVVKALGAFQRTLLSFNAPYDRAQRGEPVAFSGQAMQGAVLFEQKNCRSCHSGQNFTDNSFHDIGLPPASRDAGLIEKTGEQRDANRFRTPSLRNVGVTGPFMHDGSISSISGSILAHTRGKGGGKAPAISADEAAALSLFLETLTDKTFIESKASGGSDRRCEAP